MSVCYVITLCRRSYQYTNGFTYNCQEAQLTNRLTCFLEQLSENGAESAAPDFQAVLAHLAGPEPNCLSNIVLIFIYFSGKDYFIHLEAETSAWRILLKWQCWHFHLHVNVRASLWTNTSNNNFMFQRRKNISGHLNFLTWAQFKGRKICQE